MARSVGSCLLLHRRPEPHRGSPTAPTRSSRSGRPGPLLAPPTLERVPERSYDLTGLVAEDDHVAGSCPIGRGASGSRRRASARPGPRRGRHRPRGSERRRVGRTQRRTSSDLSNGMAAAEDGVLRAHLPEAVQALGWPPRQDTARRVAREVRHHGPGQARAATARLRHQPDHPGRLKDACRPPTTPPPPRSRRSPCNRQPGAHQRRTADSLPRVRGDARVRPPSAR